MLSVLLLILCIHEMCCWKGTFKKGQVCKVVLIPLIEFLDFILEIAIVAVFSELQEEYNDNRSRAIDVAKVAGLV